MTLLKTRNLWIIHTNRNQLKNWVGERFNAFTIGGSKGGCQERSRGPNSFIFMQLTPPQKNSGSATVYTANFVEYDQVRSFIQELRGDSRTNFTLRIKCKTPMHKSEYMRKRTGHPYWSIYIVSATPRMISCHQTAPWIRQVVIVTSD